MADTKISALTAVTTPAGTDQIPVNQSSTTKLLYKGAITPNITMNAAGITPRLTTASTITED